MIENLDKIVNKYIDEQIQKEIESEKEVFKNKRDEELFDKIRKIYTKTTGRNFDYEPCSKQYLIDNE